MSEWKAVLREKSEVDAGGECEIAFEILIDGKVVYPNMRTTLSVADAKTAAEAMRRTMASLKERRDAVKGIPDRLEVTLSEK